jgi:hypothetical protein
MLLIVWRVVSSSDGWLFLPSDPDGVQTLTPHNNFAIYPTFLSKTNINSKSTIHLNYNLPSTLWRRQ